MDAPDRLTLEATLPAASAARLARHPAIATRRSGRSRGGAVETAWHDTQDGALAALGLVLETARNVRRLVRSLPEPGAFWCPGMVEAPLRVFARGDAPEEAGGAPLLPIAAFNGKRLAFALGPVQADVQAVVQPVVQAVLLQGRVRSLTAEEPVARLTLSGPPEPVLALARALAEDMPLLPPVATLAEQGRALARGDTLRARRQGAPDTAGAATVERALAHAIGHLLEVALWHAPAAIAGTAPEGVHQLRVALRRLRSALRLFRRAVDGPALRAFDAALREILAGLGPARDWDVWLGGLGAELAAAMPGEKRVARLIALAEAERRRAYDSLRVVLDGPAIRRVIWDGVALTQLRAWRADASAESLAALDAPLADFAGDVLARSGKGCAAMRGTSRSLIRRRCTRCAWMRNACATRRRSSRRCGRVGRRGASPNAWRSFRMHSASPTTPRLQPGCCARSEWVESAGPAGWRRAGRRPG